jgi:Flp pilus assembly protein TadG
MSVRAGERGSIAVEVAILAPAFVALLLLVVFAGRVSEAEAEVRRAASQAARAASLRQDGTAAVSAAEAAVTANLADSGFICGELDVAVDTTALRPGGTVAVTVRCTADMSDIALLGVPGSRTFMANAIEVVDTYRGG